MLLAENVKLRKIAKFRGEKAARYACACLKSVVVTIEMIPQPWRKGGKGET